MLRAGFPLVIAVWFLCLSFPLAGGLAVPADSHEPVTGGVQVPATPNDRAAALYLLERARQNSLNHRRGTPPYRFTASFTAAGNVADIGAGELTETWFNGQKWRWTANLGSSSIVRIASRGQLFENGHAVRIPMRAHMLRNEIFWALDEYASKAQLRTAPVQWNGKPATCILASGITGPATQTQGRLWEEEEYCVDNSSGLLLVHSIAPGTFAVFDYAANQQLQGRTLPNRITLYVAGALAADASFTIAGAGSADESSLTPGAEMTTSPPPVTVRLPSRFPIFAPPVPGAGAAQSVMLHVEIDAAGKIAEEELSAASDPALIPAALELVRKMNFGANGGQRQMYVNVKFGPSVP